MIIVLILLILYSLTCSSSSSSIRSGMNDNNMNNNDAGKDILEHKRRLMIELDNRIRRSRIISSIDEKLIEDIILYDNINNNTILSIEQKNDIIYNALDTKWEHSFYRFDRASNTSRTIKGWVGRKMIGSNCVVIERAIITKYYKCEGCVIEQALGCLNDLRMNISGNVPHGCNISYIGHLPLTSCCPAFGPDTTGNVNLIATTAGYPDTLRCIQSVGCGDSDVYTSLLEECQYTCPLKLDPDDRTVAKTVVSDQAGNDACLAKYNAGYLQNELSYTLIFIIAVMTLVIL